MVDSVGTCASVWMVCSRRSRAMMRSISWKYSIRMPVDVSRGLDSDQLVDAGAQVVELKVLLRGRPAVIDLLGPLLERQFDSKCLVDRERNIEKIQAVDA